MRPGLLTLSENALREWVAGVTVHAGAHWGVTDHVAVGVRAARADARVLALLIDAGQVIGALAVAGASHSAIGRTADKAGQAGAQGYAVGRSALGVGPTGGRFARRRRSWRGR